MMMQRKTLFVTLFYMCFSALTLQCHGLTQQEIAALEAINKKWNVPEWQGSPNCSWKHLTCIDGDGILTRLTFKNQGDKRLCAKIPSEICQLINIEELTISDQLIPDVIPDCLGNLSKLRHLHMPGNRLTGPIPDALGKLKNLTHLDLSGNTQDDADGCKGSSTNNSTRHGLTGQIPPALFNLPKIQHIALSYNNLTSKIPDSVGNATFLNYLTIDYNHLDGEIPHAITTLHFLEILRLNTNNLTGSIPDASTDQEHYWPALYLLDLRNNNLTGRLPDNLIATDIHSLLLSGNKHISDETQHWKLPIPQYLHVDPNKRSIINLSQHFECPAFILELERGNPLKNTIVELDPEYYDYSLCFCSNKYYGVAPNKCKRCPLNGNCSVIEMDTVITYTNDTLQTIETSDRLPKDIMSFKVGFYPVPMDQHYESIYVKGLEPCIWVHDGFSPCNPNGTCVYFDNLLVQMGNNASNDQWCTLCAEGYMDRLCSKCNCTSGKTSSCYFHSHKRCTKCTSAPKWQVAALIILSFIVIISYGWFNENTLVRLLLLVIAVAFLLACEASSWFYYETLFISIILLPATTNGLSSGLVKSLIFFLQTLSTIAVNILPPTIVNIIGHLQFINLQPVGLVCLFPQTFGASKHAAINEFIVHLCAPYIIFAAQCAVLSIKAVINKCRGCQCVIENGNLIKCQKCKSNIKQEILFSIIFITYFAFFNAATGIASVFHCHQDAAMDNHLVTRPYIQCGSYEQQLMQGIALLCGIFFLLIPIIVFTALLYLYKHRLWNEDDDIRKWLGYLYLSYKPAPKWMPIITEGTDQGDNIENNNLTEVNHDGEIAENHGQSNNVAYNSMEHRANAIEIEEHANDVPINIQIAKVPANEKMKKPRWYHNYLYFSEILFMILRLLLAVSLNVFSDEQLIWKNIGVLGVLILIIVVFVILKPYRIGIENIMGCVSVFILMFNFFGSTQIEAMRKYSHPIRLSVQWFFFLINVVMVAIFVIVILKHGWKNIKANARKVKQFMGDCLVCVRRQDDQQIAKPLI